MRTLQLCLIGLLVGTLLAQVSQQDYMNCLSQRQCSLEQPTCPPDDSECAQAAEKLKTCVETNASCLNLRPTVLDENSVEPVPAPYQDCFRACYAVPYDNDIVNQYAQCVAQCGTSGTVGIASAVTTVDASQFTGVVTPTETTEPEVVVVPTPTETTPTETTTTTTTPEVVPVPVPTPTTTTVTTPEPTVTTTTETLEMEGEGEMLVVTPSEGEDVLITPPPPTREVVTRTVTQPRPVVQATPVIPVVPVQPVTTITTEGEGEAQILEGEDTEESPTVALVRTRTTTAAVVDGEVALNDGELIIGDGETAAILRDGEIIATDENVNIQRLPRNVNIRTGGGR